MFKTALLVNFDNNSGKSRSDTYVCLENNLKLSVLSYKNSEQQSLVILIYTLHHGAANGKNPHRGDNIMAIARKPVKL